MCILAEPNLRHLPSQYAEHALPSVRRIYIDSGDAPSHDASSSSRKRELKERIAQLEAANQQLKEERAAQERRAERYKGQLREAEAQDAARRAERANERQSRAEFDPGVVFRLFDPWKVEMKPMSEALILDSSMSVPCTRFSWFECGALTSISSHMTRRSMY